MKFITRAALFVAVFVVGCVYMSSSGHDLTGRTLLQLGLGVCTGLLVSEAISRFIFGERDHG